MRSGEAARSSRVFERTLRVRMMIFLNCKGHQYRLIRIPPDVETHGVGARAFRKSGALAACITHVAALAHQAFVRLERRSVLCMADARPEVAQRQQRFRIE